MSVRSCRRDFAKVRGQARGSLVGGGLAPRVVCLDDVDAVGQLDNALGSEVVPSAIQRVGHVGEPAHLVDPIHHLLGSHVGTQPVRDEQPDDLALPSLGLLADDGEVRCDLRKLQRTLDGVVVGEADAIEAALAAARDQVL
jgi:hypothetical protein